MKGVLQSTHLQTCATSYGKERMTQKATLIAQFPELSATKNHSQASALIKK